MPDLNKSEFKKCLDEELVKTAKNGDSAAIYELIRRYDPKIERITQSFFLPGGDRDDLMQEARMALLYAIKDYDPAKNDSFEPFARLCIKRRIIRAVEQANTQKNRLLNEFISVDALIEDGETGAVRALSLKTAADPEHTVLEKEAWDEFKRTLILSLSDLEQDVFLLLESGYDYHAIAALLAKDEKAIDNAKQRIRKKAAKIRS